MNQAIVTAGMRTPFGRAFKGAYRDTRPDDLLVELLRANRNRYSVLWDHPAEDLIVGCAYPEGEQGYNLARMAALGAGLDVPGATVNRLCASSLEAAVMAAARIKSGWNGHIVVGGVESMSRVPRRGANFSESDRIKSTYPQAYIPNGDTAEEVARRYPQMTRDRQEDLAAASHERAHAAYENGFYDHQIHPFLIERDEFIRYPVDRAKMASLAPAFDENGVVTAATSSPLTDGAACGMVLEKSLATELGVENGIEIVDATVAHVAPEVMGLGPVPATRLLFKRQQLTADNIAAYEINEAFAIQVLASIEELQLPADRVNTWGGAMAVGHPLGASGLRLLITLHDRLAAIGRNGALGVATLCVGGGQGMAVLVKYFDGS